MLDTDKWWQYDVKGMAAIAKRLGDTRAMMEGVKSSWRMRQGGNQLSPWDALLSFFQDIVKLPIDYSGYNHWRVLAERSGPRLVHAQFCIISDRPIILTVDEQNRPHNDTGPFSAWSDGSALYAIHGVQVPAWIILHPERINVQNINEERNMEVRRVMIDKFGHARYVTEAGGRVIDTGATDHKVKGLRGARLLSIPTEGFEHPLTVLEMVNSTAEPDGTFKKYHISINPEHYNGEAGRNVWAAMASTWRWGEAGKLAGHEPEELFFTTWFDYCPDEET